MGNHRNPDLLFNWIFLTGVVLLALNDHLFKWEFSNWLTGKLSDFIGLLILPMFILFIFPRLKGHAIVLCGIFFIFWKLPVSENLIELYNQFTFIPISRTVDYTDLIALTVLPISYLLNNNIAKYRIARKPLLSPLFVLIPSSFIFMATSPPISYYMKPNGDIYIGKSYKMKVSKATILNKLKEQGYVVKTDSSKKEFNGDQYLIENVILNKNDTIKSIQFGFKRDFILINNINLNGKFKVSDWRALKRYAKHYNKLIKSELIKDLEN
jgi:hypothetical protein